MISLSREEIESLNLLPMSLKMILTISFLKVIGIDGRGVAECGLLKEQHI